MEQILEFKNKNNERLCGILQHPDINNSKNVCIIMINSGLVDRVGPHRLYVKIARRLNQDGYSILRFDCHGLGNSEGALKGSSTIENFILVANGCLVDDVLASVSYIDDLLRPSSIVLLGLCGGAVTALIAAAREAKISKIILLDLPVYLDTIEYKQSEDDPTVLKWTVELYKNKIFELNFWMKLFSGRINFAKHLKVAYVYIKMKIPYITKKKGMNEYSRPLNMGLIKSFLIFVKSQRKIFFILADSNLVSYEFKERFEKKYLTNDRRNFFSVERVKNANHEFHASSAQGFLIEAILRWLERS